jgi:hypothetical protein
MDLKIGSVNFFDWFLEQEKINIGNRINKTPFFITNFLNYKGKKKQGNLCPVLISKINLKVFNAQGFVLKHHHLNL